MLYYLPFIVTLLLVPGTSSLAQQPTAWTEKLFTAYFQATPRKAMDANPSAFASNPKELAKLKRDSVLLYKGIALLAENETGKALIPLRKAAAGMEHVVSNNAEWYLALCYLRLKQLDQAEYRFHLIAEKEVHPFQDDAEMVYQYLLGMRGRR